MKLHRYWPIGVLLVALGIAAAPAAAAPVTVNLRIEGSSSTIFEGQVTTDAKTIDNHPCDGTNGGANPTPGPTITTALDDASIANGFSWSGTWYDSFQDFSIDRIGPDASSTTTNQYWGYAYNWQESNVGGCQQEVQAGDDIIFAYDYFSKAHLLKLSGPAKAATGKPVTVKVVDGGDSSAISGARVGGATTGTDGTATLTFSSPGTVHLKAERSDSVRSNRLDVCVYVPGSGECNTPKAPPPGAPTQPTPSTQPTAPPADTVPPTVALRGIRSGAHFRRGHGPRKLAGSASDAGGLFQVYFRLVRKTHAGCQWYSSKRSEFTNPHRRCHARFQRVGTDAKWSYLLPRRLPRGLYMLQEKAIDRSWNAARATAWFRVIGGLHRRRSHSHRRRSHAHGRLKATSAGAPRVAQLVVFRNGSAKQRVLRARQATVRVAGRRCAVPAGTPLAALVRSRVARLRLRDFGSCSRRPRDASGLFVERIGRDMNKGQNGWVYKVGHRMATAGAADPSGPFGHGRLRSGARIVWFYCHMHGSSCQRTLAFTRVRRRGRAVVVRVRAYDDRGRGVPVAGVTVHVGHVTATTGRTGAARIVAGEGRHPLWADGAGLVRTFRRRVVLR